MQRAAKAVLSLASGNVLILFFFFGWIDLHYLKKREGERSTSPAVTVTGVGNYYVQEPPVSIILYSFFHPMKQ